MKIYVPFLFLKLWPFKMTSETLQEDNSNCTKISFPKVTAMLGPHVCIVQRRFEALKPLRSSLVPAIAHF